MNLSDLDIQRAADIIATLVAKIESDEMDAPAGVVAQLEGAAMALRSLSGEPDRAEDKPS